MAIQSNYDNQSFEFETAPKLRNASHPLPVLGHDDIGSANSRGDDESEFPEQGQLESFKSFSSHEENAVIKKLDRHLVLFLALLYMLSFLDRSNIGNARIAGLSKDLSLSSSQYEWILTSFYGTYIVFQWMTLLYRVVPAHIYISLCVASWGIVASLQSVAPSFLAMFLLRALLGIGEAAFSPGVPFLLSFFYKREELALRTGLFISAAPLATSFAGSLAWLITKAVEKVPVQTWRLLFLVEGFPAIIVAVIAWYKIPDSPHTARFLNRREKKIARIRLGAGKDAHRSASEKPRLDWHEISQTLRNVKCWITAFMFFSCNVAFSSLPPFLPTIIHEMEFSALASQALSAPPYLVAFLVVLLTAFLSDRSRNRSHYIIFHAIMGSLGYLLIAIAGALRANFWWRYFGVFPAASGFFSAITLILAWTINNQDSDSKRGTGVAILNLVGQFGPLLGTRIYPDSDRPYYVKGMSICSGFMILVAILALVLRTILAAENRRYGGKEIRKEHEEERLVEDKAGSTQVHYMNML